MVDQKRRVYREIRQRAMSFCGVKPVLSFWYIFMTILCNRCIGLCAKVVAMEQPIQK